MFGIGITEIIIAVSALAIIFIALKENGNINFQLYWNQLEKAVSEATDDLYSKYLDGKGELINTIPSGDDLDVAYNYVEEQAEKARKKLKLKNKHIRKKILAQFNSKVSENKRKN